MKFNIFHLLLIHIYQDMTQIKPHLADFAVLPDSAGTLVSGRVSAVGLLFLAREAGFAA